MPCFEGLLEEPHNTSIMSLLYVLAFWHSFAKLRMHTDTSLAILDDATTCLGISLRYFSTTTCPAFDTQETAPEQAARGRRQQAAQSSAPTTRRARTFNLKTVKLHFLGDYVESIKRFGTTDSISTAPVSINHVYSQLR